MNLEYDPWAELKTTEALEEAVGEGYGFGRRRILPWKHP
jgi:hypothetical protein